MVDPGINPHDLVVEELQAAMAEGTRFAFDIDIVVLADLRRSKPNCMPNPVKGCDLSLFPMKKEC